MRHLLAPLLLVASALAAPAAAQTFTFQIDQPQSNFTWSGNTSLGPLVGNPSNAFQVAGTAVLELDSGGNPVGAGRILSSNAAVIPDLHGKIPNPLPFLPPLATIDVTNLVLDVSSDPFAVSGSGAFTTNVVLTALSGTLTVTPLGSSPTVTSLAGQSSTPTPTSGSITAAGAGLHLVVPVNSTFSFTDPGSGTSGTLTVTGTIRADFACPTPATYCTAAPNSVGGGALIASGGSTSIDANDLSLQVSGAIPGQPGLFYYGPNAIQVPFGDGFRCVGGGVLRLAVQQASPAGAYSLAVDQNALPPGGAIEAGDTWRFQCWYRDPASGGAGFNFSNGLEVFFCP